MLLTVEKMTYCNIKNNKKNYEIYKLSAYTVDSVSFYYGRGPPHGPKPQIQNLKIVGQYLDTKGGIFTFSHTVIRIAYITYKFGICTVVGLNGTLAEAKILTFKSRKGVGFSLQKVSHLDPRWCKCEILAPIETKRITVHPQKKTTLQGLQASKNRHKLPLKPLAIDQKVQRDIDFHIVFYVLWQLGTDGMRRIRLNSINRKIRGK